MRAQWRSDISARNLADFVGKNFYAKVASKVARPHRQRSHHVRTTAEAASSLDHPWQPRQASAAPER